jgi:hypothetical protein
MKRVFWLIVLFTGICAMLFTQNTDAENDESKAYKIGDTGPAGGVIFYDKGNYSDDSAAGWRYLEMAPAEIEFSAPWGGHGVNISGTSTAIGAGKVNTDLIVEQLLSLGETECAAQLCDKLAYRGFTDWFLPSKDELDLIYKNLRQTNMVKFGTRKTYWSSSQANDECVWYQNFDSGSQFNYGNYKYNLFDVRAIRAF